jgi:short-subunit dehydrogenase
LIAELQQFSSNVTGLDVDLLSDDSVSSLIQELSSKPVTRLVHNAGVVDSKPFQQQTLQEFRDIMKVNLEVPLFVTKALASSMLPDSQVLLLNSLIGKFYTPGLSFASISRAAGRMAWSGLKTELKAQKIHVGLASPGMVDTDGLRDSVINKARAFPVQSLWTAEQAARYLKYVLMDTDDKSFETKDWDISTTAHHAFWLRADESPPKQ